MKHRSLPGFFVAACLAAGLVVTGCATRKPMATETLGASFETLDARARAGMGLSVVFYGGAITWGMEASDPNVTSYRALVSDYLQKKYPSAAFTFHNAAIGAGSKLAMHRLAEDVIARRPDLVFLEFTADDNPGGTDRGSLAAYERILRDLISRNIPVVQVLAGFKHNFGLNYKPWGGVRVNDHRELGRLYRTAVADSFPHVQHFLGDGKISREEIWPADRIYPNDVGHRLIFDVVRDAYEKAVKEKTTGVPPMDPVFARSYTIRHQLDLTTLPLSYGWRREASFLPDVAGVSSRWVTDVVVADSAEGAEADPLQLSFTGNFIGLIGEADENGLDFRVVIDGKQVPYYATPFARPAAVWPANTLPYGGGKLFFWREIGENLANGPHTLELFPVMEDNRPVGQLRIQSICVAAELE